MHSLCRRPPDQGLDFTAGCSRLLPKSRIETELSRGRFTRRRNGLGTTHRPRLPRRACQEGHQGRILERVRPTLNCWPGRVRTMMPTWIPSTPIAVTPIDSGGVMSLPASDGSCITPDSTSRTSVWAPNPTAIQTTPAPARSRLICLRQNYGANFQRVPRELPPIRRVMACAQRRHSRGTRLRRRGAWRTIRCRAPSRDAQAPPGSRCASDSR
jgi:hypothetical protein